MKWVKSCIPEVIGNVLLFWQITSYVKRNKDVTSLTMNILSFVLHCRIISVLNWVQTFFSQRRFYFVGEIIFDMVNHIKCNAHMDRKSKSVPNNMNRPFRKDSITLSGCRNSVQVESGRKQPTIRMWNTFLRSWTSTLSARGRRDCMVFR